MKLRYRKIIYLTILVILPFISVSHLSAADAASDVTVTPFLQTVRILNTDVTKELNVTITNNAKTKQTFSIFALNFGSLDETGGLVFEGSQANSLIEKYGLTNWLKLSTEKVELDPAEAVTLIATIENRSDLSPGGHYAAIIASSDDVNISGNDQVSIRPKISSLIFATKTGGETYDMQVVGTSHNGSLWKAPTSATIRVKNTGNTQLVPRGIVSLMSKDQLFGRGVINEQSGYVLPETFRQFSVDLKSQNQTSRRLWTEYNLIIDYRYDGYDQFATKSYKFKVLNMTLVLVIIGLIIVATLSIMIYKNKKRIFKKLS